MKTPFEKLRLPPSARRTAAACILGGVGLAARAFGTVITLPKNITVGTVKFSRLGATNGQLGRVGGNINNAYGIDDVTYTHGAVNRSDAFDSGAAIGVNGLPFNLPGGKVDRTTTAAGVFVNTITPQSFGAGVNASLNYFMSATSRTLRSVGVFTNTTGASQTITVAFGANLGSDSNTIIRATASGDLLLQVSQDQYVISNQNGQSGNSIDPTETWVWFGPGGKTAATGQYVDTNDKIGEEWSLTLAPGQTQELMWFTQFSDDFAGAQAELAAFADINSLNAAGLLSGLSAAELASIQNWLANFNGPILQNSSPVNVPTTADFIVTGPVTTGGGNNTVNTLTFLPGSSLKIFNTLTVSAGQVNLVGGSSIDLNTATLKASLLNIQPGGFLGGNGVIAGNLVNAGTVSPGHSPGKIQVTGNYTQTPAGTLVIEVAGKKAPNFDVLAVNGAANLNGTVRILNIGNVRLKRDQKVTFLTALGGVNGKFNTENVDGFTKGGTLLKTKVVYKSNAVQLRAELGSFSNDLGGLTENQKAVARQLDKAENANQADKLLDFLSTEQVGNLRGDLDKIAPEELASVFNIGMSLANVQTANLERRMGDIQAGAAGFSASGYAMSGGGPSYSGEANYNSGATSYGARGPEGKGGKELLPPSENRWGVFVTGTGEFTDIENTTNARGYDLQTGGLTVGADYKITPNFAVGINGGYAHSTAHLAGNGSVTVDGGKLGLYATYFTGTGFYADAAVSGGLNSYDTRRAAIKGRARGSTNGAEINALFATGYDWKSGGLSIGPVANVQYTNVGMDGFRERGSLAPLKFSDQSGESLRTALGMKASYDIQAGGVVIRPEVRATWQHEFGDSSYGLTSRLANGAGNTFTVNGPEIGDDSLLVGAGVAVLWNERTSTYVYYDGEIFRSNYSSNNVSGGVRVAF